MDVERIVMHSGDVYEWKTSFLGLHMSKPSRRTYWIVPIATTCNMTSKTFKAIVIHAEGDNQPDQLQVGQIDDFEFPYHHLLLDEYTKIELTKKE